MKGYNREEEIYLIKYFIGHIKPFKKPKGMLLFDIPNEMHSLRSSHTFLNQFPGFKDFPHGNYIFTVAINKMKIKSEYGDYTVYDSQNAKIIAIDEY